MQTKPPKFKWIAHKKKEIPEMKCKDIEYQLKFFSAPLRTSQVFRAMVPSFYTL